MTNARTDPQSVIDDAAGRILAGGIPGVHLSVSSPHRRVEACLGHGQSFGDGGASLVRRLTRETAHDLGSVTKVVGTTGMLMSLVSAARLDLDTEVARFLPGFVGEATIRDLLVHRGGLWEWWPTYLSAACPDEALDVVTGLPQRYRARTGRHYSDLGFMVLGRVVELVTTLPLTSALEELVTAPLGLATVGYGAPPTGLPVAASSRGDRIERAMVETGEPYPVPVDASGFDRWRTRVLVGEVNDGNAFHAFGGAAGHAGLFATVDALHTFGRAVLASAAGRGPWPSDVVAAFWETGADAGQLLGFRSWDSEVGSCRAQMIGHTGFPGVALAVIPQHDASVVLATNRLHVLGAPLPFDPAWRAAMGAAHAALHSDDLRSGDPP